MNTVLNPLVCKDLSIEIIDTYTNTRPLIEERTQAGSPVIEWGNEDDLIVPFFMSKLTFNMLVPDAADGKFSHLFTGDENRYKVQLWTNDLVNSTRELIWQGFLLPDIYNEPYAIGAFFVDFTAVDGLQSLKDKYLDPWLYFNRMPLIKALSHLLKLTGLSQEIIVAPTLVPAHVLYTWTSINVPLHQYYDKDDGYTDAYSILEDILKPHLLTLSSYRGYWFIEGVSRKSEIISYNCLKFDSDGDFIEKIDLIREQIEPIKSTTPTVGILPPYKKVDVSFDMKQDNKLFSDDVVFPSKLETTLYIDDSAFVDAGDPFKGYLTYADVDAGNLFYPAKSLWRKDVLPFTKVDSGDGLDFEQWTYSPLSDKITWLYFMTIFRCFPGSMSTVTEAVALENYFECQETPQVIAGVKYKFKFKLIDVFLSTSGFNQDNLENGLYDGMAAFQLFIDNREFMAKRPGYTSNAYRYNYSVTYRSSLGADVDFTLEHEFVAPVTGRLKFRLLHPINQGTSISLGGFRTISELSCEIAEDLSNKKLVAERSVKYSTKFSHDIKITSASSEAIKNNFGIGLPLNPVFENDIDVTSGASNIIGRQLYFSQTPSPFWRNIDLVSCDIDESLYDIIMYQNADKNFYVLKSNGNKIHLISVYLRKNEDGSCRFAYLTGYDDESILPDDYKKETYVIPGVDELKHFFYQYDLTDVLSRSNWRIEGYAENIGNSEFNKVIAQVIHATRPYPTLFFETEYKQLIFPGTITMVPYMGVNKKFIQTKMSLNLDTGKTKVSSVEAVFAPVNDISYD